MEQFRYISFINSRLSFNKYVFTRQNFIGLLLLKKKKTNCKRQSFKIVADAECQIILQFEAKVLVIVYNFENNTKVSFKKNSHE